MHGREAQPNVQQTEVHQCSTQEIQDENKQQQCPTQADTLLEDRQKMSKSEKCKYVVTEAQKW